MELIQLQRYTSRRLLGTGASYEVHEAVDSQTGAQVVLKRPWAQYITHNQHQHADRLSARLIEMHRTLGASFPHISHLVGYTDCTRHDQFFGDTLTHPYHVLVEERAKGVPLVGGIKDKFLGVPIGLAQNLYALYPMVSHAVHPSPGILQQLLELAEGCYRHGFLALDLGPQNVYYDPMQGRITVIDLGDFRDRNSSQGGQRTPDLHDALLELCKFYLTPHQPPSQVSGYRDPFGMGSMRGFEQDLNQMIHHYHELTTGALQEAAVNLLQKVKRRAYESIEEFRQEVQHYLGLAEERNRALPDLPGLVEVWREGLGLLHDKYWRRFLFDPETDLVHYR